ncbi:Multi antimicrobial extrusion protein [Parasponia andersonii]|uniref:Protein DETOXIFICATION n=1 Tax=Parasponia andersonii TaxID=3476 RepID=A0A2P5CYV2_PARAD|nr:Multi antimicrobial extrusion protein [Parasponia andersonii]
MAATQFSGGSVSNEIASRVAKSNQTTEKYKPISLVRRVGDSGKLFALNRQKSGHVDVVGDCNLSGRHRQSLRPVVIHRKKKGFPVVGNQWSSDSGVGSSEVEERLVLQEENSLNGGGNGAPELAEFPSSRSNSPDVKREILMLSIPAFAGQALDPLAQLMETAYIGRLGSLELGSAGVSVNIFNYISKLFNIPLLSVATSFVAEDIAKNENNPSASEKLSLEDSGNGRPFNEVAERKQLPSVSTALLLAVMIGIVEALALSLGSGLFLNIMGISSDSPMRVPAQHFLSLRALGAPAVVVSLALQGVFRGFKDTKTPVLCIGIGNLLAVVLFPILMYSFQLGATGAALSTVMSQYIVTFLMLWSLNKRAILLPPKMRSLQFRGYIKSGGFLLGRTLAVLTTMTLGTSMAARQGPVAMAAHQICIQVWLAVSLLVDALGASAQALTASYLSKGDHKTVKEIVHYVLKVGLLTGLSLSAILGLSFGSLASLFTKDAEVLGIVGTGVLFVSASQPLNALAYVFDGLHYGVSDFAYAARAMMVVGAISSAFLLYAPSFIGLPGVWLGLTLFMGLRLVAGFYRLLSKNGPWWFLHSGFQSFEVGIDLSL